MLVTVSLPSGRSVDVTCSPEGLVRDLEVMVQKELGPLTLAKGDGQILDPTWSLKDAKVEDWVNKHYGYKHPNPNIGKGFRFWDVLKQHSCFFYDCNTI